jgi:integrase/recombinase XerC
MRLSEAIEALAIATRANGRSKATVHAYREKLSYLVRFLDDADVNSITVHDLRRYLAYLWDTDLSPFTISSRARALKRLFNFLAAEAILEDNPGKGIVMPDPDPQEIKAISKADLSAILSTTDGESVIDLRDRAIMLFLIDSGARVQGLAGLRVCDVDLANRRAKVIEKGNKSRLVPFTSPTVEAMEAWLKVRPQDKGPWLFIGLGPKAKGRLSERGVSHMLNRRAKRADVTGPRNPHSFRHRFAINFLLAGGDIGVLSKLMGHTSVVVTIRWYGRFAFAELQRQHEKHSLVVEMFGGDENGK